MIVTKFVLSAFQQNTRIVACEDTGQAMCIDPGDASSELVEFIRAEGMTLKAIALTHGHLDHVGGTLALHREFPEAEIILHKDDEDLYYGLPQQPLFMGISPHQFAPLGLDFQPPPKLTRNWQHGEILNVGSLSFSVRHCPGHTRGHVILAEIEQKSVFVGDCLFLGSVGRSDLPGGDHQQLITSIREQILSLGDDFVVYSGHGPETTTGEERLSNPFLNGAFEAARGRYV
ncbi:MAG TPA: MBL fold metallo-hydrolase [Pyrinomonadaceae bacterium]|nr:MBL fold metallo-hydrolase [Pyrinomonadaceae bacterium]HMP65406.1 MBL fold metallo-hydrolase [Pyrinomonadaceae bacterium]